MGIVRFALRFPHTFYVVAALILFLGGALANQVAASNSAPPLLYRPLQRHSAMR